MSTHDKKAKITKNQVIRRATLSLLVSVLLPLLIMISVPFEIYAANLNKYIFTLSEFLPVCIAFFFVFTVVIFGAIFFLPKKAFRIVSAIIIAFALLFFVQGNYLNGSLNTIAGDKLEKEVASTGTAVLNIILWIVVIAAAIVLACLKDRKNIISYIGGVMAIIILATQIVAPISVAISKPEIYMSSSEKLENFDSAELQYILTDKNVHTPSRQGNVYWFVVDRLDESFVEEAYDNDADLLNGLEGFTWFKNHLATRDHTYPSVTEMITGYEYDYKLLREEWFKVAFENTTTLSTLHDNGYSVNFYTDQYYAYGNIETLPSYIDNKTLLDSYYVKNKVGLAFSVVGVGLYRNFPFYLKNLIHINSSTSNNYIGAADPENNSRYSTSILPTADFSVREGKGFYFIHNEGCHDSYNIKDGGKQVIDNIKEINRYLNYLKQEGLYDDATIIITGDHGLSENGACTRPIMTALFVKPSGTGSGKLKTSMAPTSHRNLWATIFKSENIATDKDYGPSVFEIAEDSDIERYITTYTWKATFCSWTYRVVGDAHDFNNWEFLYNEHADKKLTD